MTIAEADWKRWRAIRQVALERLCGRILAEAKELASGGAGTNHERYLLLFQHVEKSDRTIADVFNSPRRSNAIFQIARAVRDNLVTPEEFGLFTQETQDTLKRILAP